MTRDISNSDDVIDSRDVIERIEELEELQTAETDARGELAELLASPGATGPEIATARTAVQEAEDSFSAEERLELATLLAFMEEMKGQGGDEQWRGDWYPVTIIRDSYFEDYAQEFADDIGAINSDATWPNNCIDWKRAARELQQDYTSVDFDGVTYWIR